jgi:hypothetical protein
MLESYAVYWCGEKIGEMTDPKADSFFTYGFWRPSECGDVLGQVIARIKNGDDVIVELRGALASIPRRGYVFDIPDHLIEVRCDPSLNSTTI